MPRISPESSAVPVADPRAAKPRAVAPLSLDELADRPSLAPRGLIARGRALGIAIGAAAATGAAAVAWGQLERRFPVVRHVDVPVQGSPGMRGVRILQISDLHLYPGQEFLVDFLARVARTEDVDMVVSTGDNLGSAYGLDLVRAAYAPFLHLPGVFVLGSNDYYSPRFKNWAAYLRRDPRLADDSFDLKRGLVEELIEADDPTGSSATRAAHPGHAPLDRDQHLRPDLPWHEIVSDFTGAGWVDLSNRAATLDIPVGGGEGTPAGHQTVSLIGVDDPHLDRDRIPDPDVSWGDPRALRIAVAHAPYLRVVDGFTREEPDLVLAGHTHGGQLGLPFYGALVTNCDLPRRYAKGLHTWYSGRTSTQLHVSAGLGTSPFVPLRIATRPEVSVIHLRPVD